MTPTELVSTIADEPYELWPSAIAAALRRVRAEALEEAAEIASNAWNDEASDGFNQATVFIATAIRALKEMP